MCVAVGVDTHHALCLCWGAGWFRVLSGLGCAAVFGDPAIATAIFIGVALFVNDAVQIATDHLSQGR
jgi:hypothetical protein